VPGELLAVERVGEPVAGDLSRLVFDERIEPLPSNVTCLVPSPRSTTASSLAREFPLGAPLSIVSGIQKEVQAPVQTTLLSASSSAV